MERDTTQILASVGLFQSLPIEALEAIAAAARTTTAAPGDAFFHEGDLAESFFVVLQGSVKLSQLTPEGHQVVLRLLGPGDAFGGVAAIGGQSHEITAEAVTKVDAYEWPAPAMTALLQRYPRLAMNALHFVAERLHEVQVQYRQLATEKVDRRIARALLKLVAQLGRRVDNGTLIDLPLSREDIAQMTGTTLFTVSRVFGRLETDGIIEAGRQRVVIVEHHRLRALADEIA